MPLVIIPKNVEGMNRSEYYILNKLKRLYLPEPDISYLYIEPVIRNLTPDFILIDPKRGVSIIEVKAWGINFLETINHKEVLTTTGSKLENPAHKARRYFNKLKGVFSFYNELMDKDNKLKFNLYSVVFFTELKKKDAEKNGFEGVLSQYPAKIFYKDELSRLSINQLFNNKKREIDKELIDIIRASISPEIRIIQNISNDVDDEAIDESIVTMDIEQERFAKNIPFGHYMITGIPGSGKTVTLISRAIYLFRVFPDWNILIVTYNKTLKAQIETKVNKLLNKVIFNLENDAQIRNINIEVKTFHKLAMEISSLSFGDYKDKSEEFWRDILPNDAIKNAKPIYDAILVDEYQDFYKHWFELLLKLLREHKDATKKMVKNIFFAGDRLQSIYNPKEINWRRDIGLDMRGRSKILKTSYRVTKEHIELGLQILINDEKYREEVNKFYEEAKNIVLKNSSKESIKILNGDLNVAIDKYKSLLKKFNPQDILILASSWKRINEFKSKLPSEILKKVSDSKDILDNYSILTTYYSAKGIEAKVVLVIDSEKIRDRKLLYVVITRASHKIILHSKNLETSTLGKEILEFLR